ncbi:GntR family transcriptional regulator [Bhargavaea beijingensis]|uniref:GntR family transcriptional regulator n=1 Tax=Bhargavaea beijingensis TaxID=426756 RepID=UPI0022247176|nr:GntR family transcriptional regulator [Bhargavaea beijingensis]MCW1929121.1 GntR family transcriptional regulator [Bhargavaea beijingensis]
MFKPPTPAVRVSARDLAYTELKERIVKCLFSPGQSIVEEELSSELEISRTPLREALQRLELEGLVARQSNGRLKVAPVSEEEVRELFIVRSKLEGIVVVEAMENMTEQDVRYLKYVVEMAKENSVGGSHDQVDHFGTEFHQFIYGLNKNETAIKVLFQLNDRISRYRRLAHVVDTRKSTDEHGVILNHMIAGEKERAREAIENHVLDSMAQAIVAVRAYKLEQDT